MKILPLAVLALFAGCQSSEPPPPDPQPEPPPLRVRLAWNPADGVVWTLRVVSNRHSEVQTGKEPLETRFAVEVYGELSFGAADADGARPGVFTFATLEGTIEALGVKMPLTDKPADVAGRTVAAGLDAKGNLTWDEVALRNIVEGLDLNEDLERLFPALPADPVGVKDVWTAVVERHTDTYELQSIDARAARFAGKSAAEESRGTDALGSSLTVAGSLAGEWDVDAGALVSFREERVEDAKLVTKTSTLRTKSEMKRSVTMERKK